MHAVERAGERAQLDPLGDGMLRARASSRRGTGRAGRSKDKSPTRAGIPILKSEVLEVTKRVHERVLGETPELKAVHAGLECGVIGEKLPGMDMMSIGPWIEAPHSPAERVNIPSVDMFWKLLVAVLDDLSR